MICRVCGRERELEVRKPFARQTCEACLRDKKDRIDRALAYHHSELQARNAGELAKWQALSEVDRQKELKNYDSLWGDE